MATIIPIPPIPPITLPQSEDFPGTRTHCLWTNKKLLLSTLSCNEAAHGSGVKANLKDQPDFVKK